MKCPECGVHRHSAHMPACATGIKEEQAARALGVSRSISLEEIRIVDPKTGGEKGSKLARYDLIPPHVLNALAEHYGRGARKYADRNWERGYRWGLSFAALVRHLFAWWGGEDLDEETGSSHMVAVAWHAFALAEFQRTGKGTDDRPRNQNDGGHLQNETMSLDTEKDTGKVAP